MSASSTRLSPRRAIMCERLMASACWLWVVRVMGTDADDEGATWDSTLELSTLSVSASRRLSRTRFSSDTNA